MNIVGARIDGRLVHGQVANLWTPKLQADRIIVVDEEGNLKDIMYPLIFDVNSKDYQIQHLMALGVGIMQVTIKNYQGIK